MRRIFRKKSKEKKSTDKPHIAASLLPPVALTAVPTSPPSATLSSDKLALSSPTVVTSVGSTVSPQESPLPSEPLSLHHDSVDSEPGYSTVKDTIAAVKQFKDKSSSQQQAAVVSQERSLPPVPPDQQDSQSLNQAISTSSFPSVTSENIDSEEDSIPPPLPPPLQEDTPTYSVVKLTNKRAQQTDQESSSVKEKRQHRVSKQVVMNEEQQTPSSSEHEGGGSGEDVPYVSSSYSTHRPPPHRQTHKQSKRGSGDIPQPHTLTSLPVYNLNLSGDSLVPSVFSKTNPRGQQEFFLATPLQISSAAGHKVSVGRAQSTPDHVAPLRYYPSSPSRSEFSKTESPTKLDTSLSTHSSPTKQTVEILQQLASNALPNRSTTQLQTDSASASASATQLTAEILQTLATSSGADNPDSTRDEFSFHTQASRSPRSQIPKQSPVKETVDILHQIASSLTEPQKYPPTKEQLQASLPTAAPRESRTKTGAPTPVAAATAEIIQQIADSMQAEETDSSKVTVPSSLTQQKRVTPVHSTVQQSTVATDDNWPQAGISLSSSPLASSSPRLQPKTSDQSHDFLLLKGEFEKLKSNNTSLQAEVASLRKQSNEQFRELKKRKERELQDETISLQNERYSMAQEEQRRKHQLELSSLEATLSSVHKEKTQLQEDLKLQMQHVTDLKTQKNAKVQQLTTELAHQKLERDELRRKLDAIQMSHIELKGRVSQMVETQPKTDVSLQEYKEALRNFESMMQSQRAQADRDSIKRDTKLETLKHENRSLTEKLSKMHTKLLKLSKDNHSLQQENKHCEERVARLEDEIEQCNHREVAITGKLTEAMVQVEKLSAERDTYAEIAVKNGHAASMEQLRHKLKKYDQVVSSFQKTSADILKEQDREQRIKQRNYREKLHSLQSQLKSRDIQLQELLKSKRRVDEQLNLLLKATTSSIH